MRRNLPDPGANRIHISRRQRSSSGVKLLQV